MARPIDDKMYLTKPPKPTPKAEKGKTGYSAIMSYRKNRAELQYPNYTFVDWEINDWAKRNSDLFVPVMKQNPPKQKPTSGGSGGGGGGEGGEGGEKNYSWWVGYLVEGAPSWWKGYVTDDPSPEAQYAMLINSMIPFMSPEDQRYMGDYVARFKPAYPFKEYQPTVTADVNRIPTPPAFENSDLQNFYLSKDRGKRMLETLEKMRAAAKLPEDKVGAPYRLFKSVARDIETFGSSSGQGVTRSNMRRYISSLDQKLGETQAGEAQGYGEVIRAIGNPFFSAGKLFPVSKDETGRYRFADANPRWR